MAWALLLLGFLVAIPNTFASIDFTVKRRNPDGPAWRKFGTAADKAPNSFITEEQERVRSQSLLIACFGYGAMVISAITLFVVKKPPPWSTKPSRRRPDERGRPPQSEQKKPEA